MFIENDVKLDFSDILILPKRSELKSREDVNLERTIKFLNSDITFTGIPIIAANMAGVGTFRVHNVLSQYKILTAISKHYTLADWLENKHLVNPDYAIVSLGTRHHDLISTKSIVSEFGIKYLCLDVANGYSENFVTYVKHIRKQFPNLVIMAGNVVTKEMTEALILAGVDVVKIGLGSGNFCLTRRITGVGVPQVSAVMECANYAHGLNGHVISDGGCTCPGDVSKAFCCGGDFVMLGTMLAGTDEGGGEIITRYRKKRCVDSLDDSLYEEYKVVNFFGMSSRKANDTFFGGMKEYRSSEGRESYIPYKGSINEVIKEILGGVRSTCTYIGARELRNMPKCATFIRVNNQLSRYAEKYEDL